MSRGEAISHGQADRVAILLRAAIYEIGRPYNTEPDPPTYEESGSLRVSDADLKTYAELLRRSYDEQERFLERLSRRLSEAEISPVDCGPVGTSYPPPSSYTLGGTARVLRRAWLILVDTLLHPLTPSVLVEDEAGIRIEHAR